MNVLQNRRRRVQKKLPEFAWSFTTGLGAAEAMEVHEAVPLLKAGACT